MTRPSAAVHAVFAVVLYAGLILLLLLYVPLRSLYRLIVVALVRPCSPEALLRGKAVLITGASSGIGEALVYEYARKGASLSLVARTPQALAAVAKAARECGSPEVIVVPADVSSPNDAKRAVDETVARFGHLDHLVANAGIWSSCYFEEITNITAFHKLMDVNFWGAVYMAYYALPHLKASRGNIIVMSSIAGRLPSARMSFYNASKAAVIRFFETLRAECGSQVTITILTPGYVVSNLTRGQGLLKNGEVGIDEDARDIQVGLFAVGETEDLATIAVRSACRGDAYVTWPRWYKALHGMMCVAPEFVEWFSNKMYVSPSGAAGDGSGSRDTLTTRILRATGAKNFLYPSSIRSNQNDAMKKNGPPAAPPPPAN